MDSIGTLNSTIASTPPRLRASLRLWEPPIRFSLLRRGESIDDSGVAELLASCLRHMMDEGLARGYVSGIGLPGLLDVGFGVSGLKSAPVRRICADLRTAAARMSGDSERFHLKSLRLLEYQLKRWPALAREAVSSADSIPETTLSLRGETDVILVLEKAKSMAQLMGLSISDRTRVGTALSELARNALRYAGGGTVRLSVVDQANRRGLQVIVEDRGPGIANLESILAGGYKSRTGLGLGLRGSKRLMDSFDVSSRAGGGTRVTAVKFVR